MAEREEEDRKDSKKKEKDKEKGYVAFHSDDSDELVEDTEEIRQKGKKVKREKSRTLGLPRIKAKKNQKKKEKEKEKEKKSKKKNEIQSPTHQTKNPVFGVSLAQAVKQTKFPDGIELPKVLREGIVFIEENGLGMEGIYRVSGAKSKVDILKELYNEGKPVDLKDYEPEVVASVVKSYLRELPENLLTASLIPKFNELIGMQDKKDQLERTKALLSYLPSLNRTLLAWIFTHMGHVIDRGSENKMSIQNISIVLSPTMGINHGILFIFLTNVTELFPDTQLAMYTGPLTFSIDEDEADLPSSPDAIASALAKQEAILAQLHEKLNFNRNNDDAERQDELLWEVQRKVTQLKRKLRVARNSSKRKEQKKDGKDNKKSEITDEEEHIKLLEATEAELILEQEELNLIGGEMRQRISAERNEIKRLQEEIASILQQQESEHVQSDSASEISSSETEADESELEKIMHDLIKQNEELEKKNMQLSQEIHEQREVCAEMKVQIRVLEQKKLEAEQKLEQEKTQQERNCNDANREDIEELKLTEDEVILLTAKHRKPNMHNRSITT